MNHRDYCYNVLLNFHFLLIRTLSHDGKYENVFKLSFIYLFFLPFAFLKGGRALNDERKNVRENTGYFA